MDFGFSIDLIDHEGDIFDEGILIHIGESTIIKFKSYAEVELFANKLSDALPEIKSNIPTERLKEEGIPIEGRPLTYETGYADGYSDKQQAIENSEDTVCSYEIALKLYRTYILEVNNTGVPELSFVAWCNLRI